MDLEPDWREFLDRNSKRESGNEVSPEAMAAMINGG